MNRFSQVVVVFFVMVLVSGCSTGRSISDERDAPEDYDISEDGTSNIVIMETSEGDIKIELFEGEAPKTVENFKRYVKDGFYDETVFHRVIDDFMIQGGGFTAEGRQKSTEEPIENEADNGRKNLRGKIAMARTRDPNSATSQFFINLVDNEDLDYSDDNPGYAVFGKVIEGMDIVDDIGGTETGFRFGMADWPAQDIMIENVTFG